MSDAGIFTCLNAKTGELVYEGGRVPIATKFYGASPVAFDGKILLTSEDGSVALLAGRTLGGGTTINWMTCFRPPGSTPTSCPPSCR